MSKTLKLVTFDVTNTLLKFRRNPGMQYSQVGALHGLKTGMEFILASNFKEHYKYMSQNYPNFGKHSSLSWEDWWREVVRNSFKDQTSDEKLLNVIAKDLIELYKTDECWKLAEGSIELLNYLKSKELKLGVISNFDPRLNDILCNMKLSPFFDFILTSYELGFSKPDSRVFNQALLRSKITGIRPDNALHIGDSAKRDYFGARKAGWFAVVIDGKTKKDVLLKKHEALNSEHIFNSLLDLNNGLQSGSLQL